MSKLNELREKRNAALRSAQAILVQDTVSTEDRAKADTIFAEVDAMESQIAGLERVERFEQEMRAVPAVPRPQPGQSEASTDEQRAARRKAFETYVKRGQIVEGLETRDLTNGNNGALVPQDMYPVIIAAQKAVGGILGLVTTKRTSSGEPMKIPFLNDTANGLTLVGEQGPITEVDPAFTSVMTNVDELVVGKVTISWAQRQDSAFDVEGLIAKDLFGRRYARGMSADITNGNGSNIAGLLSITAGVTSAAPAAISYADLVALYGALDPAYEQNATWTMNSTTRAALMGVEDTLGRPIFIPNPSSGAFDQLFGRPVVLNQALPNIGAGAKAVQYGDFSSGYLIRQVGDLTVVNLDPLFAQNLSSGLMGYVRAGGVVTDAGTHPILTLTQHA
jgi:HK97 family phage major capsid protein